MIYFGSLALKRCLERYINKSDKQPRFSDEKKTITPMILAHPGTVSPRIYAMMEKEAIPPPKSTPATPRAAIANPGASEKDNSEFISKLRFFRSVKREIRFGLTD
jgi:hypothetical protein